MLNYILSSRSHNYPHHHLKNEMLHSHPTFSSHHRLKNEIYYKHFWFTFTSLCSTTWYSSAFQPRRPSGDLTGYHFWYFILQVFLCFEYWLLKWLALLTTERENFIQVSNLFPSWKNLRVNKIFITLGGDSGNASENRSENYRQEA